MAAYTGPVPPTPGQNATDAQWQSWWAYQNLLRDLRYEDERAARAVVTDRQHAERLAAEAACQAAQRAAAAATQAQADAMRYAVDTPAAAPLPSPPYAWTDAELLLTFVRNQLEAGRIGAAVMTEAKAQLSAYKAATLKPTPAPK